MKERFPILEIRIRVSIDEIPKVILSYAVLHNISKHLNEGWEFQKIFDIEEDENGAIAVELFNDNEIQVSRRGQRKRDETMTLLTN